MIADEAEPAEARAERAGTPERGRRGPRPQQHDRPKRRVVNGWVILDKPVGMTSTHAVAAVKRALNAKKAGHAGTLDPLASGILPIALGEATKTVPYVMDGRKSYVFTIDWGVETDTDDSEGQPVETREARPAQAEIEALLPRFVGQIEQVPPRYSAVKIAGERAYDLARDGEIVELKARTVEVTRLAVVAHERDRSVIEADCGKGTYVRALARDLGRALGCLGHVSALRRTRVGPFAEADTTTIPALEETAAAPETLPGLIFPVMSALTELPAIPVSRDGAGRLMRGQSIVLRGRDSPVEGRLYATLNGALVAIGDIDRGEFVPHRVFNLGE